MTLLTSKTVILGEKVSFLTTQSGALTTGNDTAASDFYLAVCVGKRKSVIFIDKNVAYGECEISKMTNDCRPNNKIDAWLSTK